MCLPLYDNSLPPRGRWRGAKVNLYLRLHVRLIVVARRRRIPLAAIEAQATPLVGELPVAETNWIPRPPGDRQELGQAEGLRAVAVYVDEGGGCSGAFKDILQVPARIIPHGAGILAAPEEDGAAVTGAAHAGESSIRDEALAAVLELHPSRGNGASRW